MAPGQVESHSELGFEHVLVPGSSATTLLLLHGTGGDEHQLVELGRALAPRAALLAPRGKVLEGGVARRFFRRHSLGELDIPDLLERTDELAEFVASATAAYGLDPAGLVALGYSNGANIAASLLLRRPGAALGGAALLRATLPYEPEEPLALDGKPVLIASGARDPYVPPALSERLADILRAAGADVVYRVTAPGHQLAQADLEVTASWLAGVATDSPQ